MTKKPKNITRHSIQAFNLMSLKDIRKALTKNHCLTSTGNQDIDRESLINLYWHKANLETARFERYVQESEKATMTAKERPAILGLPKDKREAVKTNVEKLMALQQYANELAATNKWSKPLSHDINAQWSKVIADIASKVDNS